MKEKDRRSARQPVNFVEFIFNLIKKSFDFTYTIRKRRNFSISLAVRNFVYLPSELLKKSSTNSIPSFVLPPPFTSHLLLLEAIHVAFPFLVLFLCFLQNQQTVFLITIPFIIDQNVHKLPTLSVFGLFWKSRDFGNWPYRSLEISRRSPFSTLPIVGYSEKHE